MTMTTEYNKAYWQSIKDDPEKLNKSREGRRRRYRMMSPERRAEFLAKARERSRMYRLKQKIKSYDK